MIPHRRDTPPIGSGFCDDCECYATELRPAGEQSLCLGCTIRTLVLRYLRDQPATREGGWHRRSDMLRALIDAGWVASHRELRPQLVALQDAGRIEQEWVSDERSSLSWYRAVGVAP